MSVPDQKILNAAIGWLELGNPVEAHNELERLPHDQRTALEVLKLRCRIYRQAERWDCLSMLADSLYTALPQEQFLVDWAWSEFKLGRKERAALVLLHESGKFPNSEAVAYHLAIVLAALDRLPEAREWLAKALARSSDPDKLKLGALDLPEFRSFGGTEKIRLQILADDSDMDSEKMFVASPVQRTVVGRIQTERPQGWFSAERQTPAPMRLVSYQTAASQGIGYMDANGQWRRLSGGLELEPVISWTAAK
jgi:tetratricopeptide (TPR) repeat protein